jgi:pyruvate dehydrogenase E2 component (dihydrolipoamide acetyltransferase)
MQSDCNWMADHLRVHPAAVIRGMYGMKSFNAIINPPQSCILAAGAAEQRPVVQGDRIDIGTVMSSTLSVDHRSVDGAVAAQFLTAFRRYMESPVLLCLGNG